MYVSDKELGDFLLDARLLGRAQLEDMLAASSRESTGLYAELMKRSMVPEDELRRAAAHVLGVPFAAVLHEDIDAGSLMLVPEPIARTHSVAVFRVRGHAADVLLLDLDALTAVAYLESEQHLTLVPHLTDRTSLKRALLMQQKALKERYGEKLKNNENASALDALLSHALLSRASEIHLESRPGNEGLEMLVRYRSGGTLYDAMVLPRQAANIASRLRELASLSFTMAVPQEGKFKVTLANGERLRVRTAVVPAHQGEKTTLHLARESTGQKGFTLDTLGFHGESLELLHEALARNSGLILVAAPPSGGKTTVLYAILDSIATAYRSTASVEEKVQIPLAHVTQVPTRKELGLTTAAALRAVLRQRPDVVMVDEVLDEDTASLVASAASRGTLIIAGIEAGSAAEAIQKMRTLGVPPALLASALSLSLAQHVAKKVCPHCKEEYSLSRVEAAPLEQREDEGRQGADFGRVLAALKAEGIASPDAQWKGMLFSRATGCSKCELGYLGEIGLQEVLPNSTTVKDLILKGAAAEAIAAGADMPLSILEDGLFKAAQGLTSIEEITPRAGL